MLKQEHRKLKERMEKLAVMDYMAFMSLSAESFSPIPPTDLSNSFSEEVQAEGERRRQEMLEAARTLDERYQFLLREEPKPEKKSTKAAPKPPATPAKAISVAADDAMDVEVVGEGTREHGRPEEALTARPSLPVAPAPKSKNKGGRPRVITAAQATAAPQASNAVASGSGRKPGKATKPPTATTLGKRRAGSSAAIEPVVNRRSPTPPPPSSTATRDMSVDMSETNGVSMEVSDVRTPMPPMPPISPRPAPPPLVTLRHRVVGMPGPPLTTAPPPPIQPEQLPVVQGAHEDEIISRPSKRQKMSAKTPERQSSAPPLSPVRPPAHQRVPSPSPARPSVRRAPSLPPIASLSSAELAAEEAPEPARESSPVPALEAMLEPEPESMAEPLPAPEELLQAQHEPVPEGLAEAPPEALPSAFPEVAPEALPEALPEVAHDTFPEMTPEPIPDVLPKSRIYRPSPTPQEQPAAPGPSAKRARSKVDNDDGLSTRSRRSAHRSGSRAAYNRQ